jgi:hypothetical protein
MAKMQDHPALVAAGVIGCENGQADAGFFFLEHLQISRKIG